MPPTLSQVFYPNPVPGQLKKNKNGRTGCLLKVSGGSRVKGAGDVPALVSCEAGGRAGPGSAPVCLSGMRTGDADPLQQPSGDRVAAGSGSPAPEDPALRGSELWTLSSGVAAGGGSRPGAAAARVRAGRDRAGRRPPLP